MVKKKKKKRTISEITQSRGTWEINPVTRVKEDKKGKHDRKEIKRKLKNGDYDF